MSFNPDEAETTQKDGPSDTDTKVSRQSSLARHAPSQSLLRHALAPSQGLGIPNALLVRSSTPTEDRPSYSKDYLTELRNCTPSTPKDLSSYNSSVEEDEDLKALDVVSKFGGGSSSRSSGAIPTETEIREKKERRARLAKEHGAEADYISLEDYDSDGEFKPRRVQSAVSTYLQKESDREDTRLVRDDEDIAEGFEDFVEDAGRVTLNKKGKREQARKELEERRELIEMAEDSSEESDSEAEANEAYEMAQSRAGMDGLRLGDSAKAQSVRKRATRGAREPSVMAKIPRLGDVVKGLKERLKEMEDGKGRMEKRMQEIDRELMKVKETEEHIQQQLVEAGEEFEKMKKEVEEKHGGGKLNGLLGVEQAEERGLESLGGTPGP